MYEERTGTSPADQMLTEKRQEEILALLGQQGSVTVQELTERFQASESTIRRDLNVLDQRGMLTKVFGGAVQKEKSLSTREEKVALRMELHREEKMRIGRYAATLVAPDDFIYLDAGTTTGSLIPYLIEYKASFVTNAVCPEACGARVPGHLNRRRTEEFHRGHRGQRSFCNSSKISFHQRLFRRQRRQPSVRIYHSGHQ